LTDSIPIKYRKWHRTLIQVDYTDISKHSLNQQYNIFSEWLQTNVKSRNWKYPLDQVDGYWTFFLKRKEDAVLFSLAFADLCEKNRYQS
jgi:hypothetical protein